MFLKIKNIGLKKSVFNSLKMVFKNVFLRPNQHIRMISEGSCKGWSKEA